MPPTPIVRCDYVPPRFYIKHRATGNYVTVVATRCDTSISQNKWYVTLTKPSTLPSGFQIFQYDSASKQIITPRSPGVSLNLNGGIVPGKPIDKIISWNASPSATWSKFIFGPDCRIHLASDYSYVLIPTGANLTVAKDTGTNSLFDLINVPTNFTVACGGGTLSNN